MCTEDELVGFSNELTNRYAMTLHSLIDIAKLQSLRVTGNQPSTTHQINF